MDNFTRHATETDIETHQTNFNTLGSHYPYISIKRSPLSEHGGGLVILTSRPYYPYNWGLVIRIYEKASLSVQIKMYR